MNEQMYYDDLIHSARHEHQSRMNALIEAEEMNLFSILRPKIYRDGNQWCVLYGENIQDGICGFGDTPMKAVYDFNAAWQRPVERKPGELRG